MVCSGRFGGAPADTRRRSPPSRRRGWRLAAALALSLAACGGESSSDANEPSGNYRVKVDQRQFPTEQRLGQTSLMQLGVRNTGKKTIPALTVTVSIAGKEGADSTLPFGDPRPAARPRPARPAGLGPCRALPEARRLLGTRRRRNLEPEDLRLRPAEAGETAEAVWKLSAVQGRPLHAPLRDRRRPQRQAKAKTGGGVKPGGSFVGADQLGAARHGSQRQRRSRRNQEAGRKRGK